MQEGGVIFTNCLLLHNEEKRVVILKMRFSLMSPNSWIGMQRMQHHEVVRIGYIMFLVTGIDIAKWTQFLIKRIEEVLQEKIKLAL